MEKIEKNVAEQTAREGNYPRNVRESLALRKNLKKVRRIIELLYQGGASDCLLVGGFVRDLFLGRESKDIDIEVYGLPYEKMLEILRPHFRVGLVGRSFGTIKVGHNIDLSIPRIETKSGTGHKGFAVSSDRFFSGSFLPGPLPAGVP